MDILENENYGASVKTLVSNVKTILMMKFPHAFVTDLDSMETLPEDFNHTSIPHIVVGNVLDAISFEWAVVIHIFLMEHDHDDNHRNPEPFVSPEFYLKYQAISRAMVTFIELDYRCSDSQEFSLW